MVPYCAVARMKGDVVLSTDKGRTINQNQVLATVVHWMLASYVYKTLGFLKPK